MQPAVLCWHERYFNYQHAHKTSFNTSICYLQINMGSSAQVLENEGHSKQGFPCPHGGSLRILRTSLLGGSSILRDSGYGINPVEVPNGGRRQTLLRSCLS